MNLQIILDSEGKNTGVFMPNQKRQKIKKQIDISDNSRQWWNDEHFVKELDARYDALELSTDSGVTIEELQISIEKSRQELYGK